MITVYPTLRQLMRNRGISYKELADIANISKAKCCLSLWGIRRWKLTESVNICCFFNTPNVEQVFVRKHFKSQFLESQGIFLKRR